MGLFGKLKSNMNHGGVKVQVQAPSSVSADQVIPVTVNISTESPQTINSVKAELKAQAREQGMVMGGGQGVGVQSGRTTYQTVAQVENREPFTIGPGETKTVNLQLYLNDSGAVNPLGAVANTGGALGGALQALASVAQSIDHVSYIYSIHASADVAGVSLDPSDKQSVQLVPPTQVSQPVINNLAPNQPPNPVAPPQPPSSIQPQPPNPPAS